MNISDWAFAAATAVGLLVAAITAVIVNVVAALAHSIDFSEQDEEFTFEDDFPGG